jgi:hypothetical protein
MLYGRFLRRILAAASRPSALLHLFPDYKTDMLPF